MLMPFRSPSRSILDFAEKRASEAAGIGSIIDSLAAPFLQQQGAQPQPQPLGAFRPDEQPTAVPQPLGAFTGPAMQPTPVDFTPQSMERLNAVDPRLRDVLTETERRAREQGIEFQISETARDPARQAELVRQGASQTMNSRHLTGNAADIFITNPDGSANWDFAAYEPVAAIAKQVAEERGLNDLVWGGDWETLKDGVHFQLGGSAGGSEVRGSSRGGMGGGNVEDILATLYPEETPEQARVQRRRDILGGIGQVFSALDTGATPDTSNIVEAQERRHTAAVSDMRERERARAAASLVFSQTGDSAMASAIATGAIQYSDVLSQQQIKRAQQEADRRAVADAAASGLVVDAMKGAGIPQEQITKYQAAIDAGAPLDSVMSAYELSQTAQEARKAAATQEETVARNIAEAETVLPTLTPGTPPYLAAQRAAQTGENYFELLPTYTGSNKVTSNVEEAQALVDAGTINPATGEPFTLPEARAATILPQQPAGFSVVIDGNKVQLTQGGAAGGGSTVGSAAPGTVNAVDTQTGELTNVPIPGAIPPQQALVDLEASRLALQQAQTNAPTEAAARAAEAELAAVNAQIAAAELAAKEQETAQLEEVAAKQSTGAYKAAQSQFELFQRQAQQVIDQAPSMFATGLVGGVANTIGQMVDTPTTRSTLLAAARSLQGVGALSALQTMKAAGVSLAPITEVELSIATASETALANPEELSADALIRNVAIQSNLMKDAVIGPRDLVRLDGFGQPYKVGPSTLGVTPDTFDQHWLSIPPDVKAEWRSGAIPALPTDDPAYAEAANVINAMTENYELYQGPLDRSVVGAVGTAPTDLPPVPEGVDPAAWRVMTDEQRALWQE